MKFEKNGKVYDTIVEAVFAFKCPTMCIDCPLTREECQFDYYNAHPVEVARKMGYTVVETPSAEPQPSAPKPTPPLCVVMGLRVGQLFRIHYPKGDTNVLYIDEDGYVNRLNPTKSKPQKKIGNSVAYAINHPESVERIDDKKIVRCPCCGKEIVIDDE